MNKQLLSKINRALKNIKPAGMAPATKEALQERLSTELEWADSEYGLWPFIKLLTDVVEKVRSAGVVTSPGYGHLTSFFLLYLAGVTRVNPVDWDLPISRFLLPFIFRHDIYLETGTGGTAVAEKVLRNRDELIIETEPGSFQITFLEGNVQTPLILHIIEYAELDRFRRTIKDGWHPLDEATLRLFGRGDTDGSIWFESDKMREWLTDFGPESMSDLVLLRALYYPGRINLFPEILRRKQHPEEIPSTGNLEADLILRDTYGILVYQEQAIQLANADVLTANPNDDMDRWINQVRKKGLSPVMIPYKDLALKGHEVARTMLSVEALWPRRCHTALK